MKKISKELLKTYYWVIVLFAIFSIFIIVNFSIYLWKENKNDIKIVEEFIEYQMDELKNRKDLEYLSKEWILKRIVNKAPMVRDVYLEMFYNDKKYAKNCLSILSLKIIQTISRIINTKMFKIDKRKKYTIIN